MDVAKLIDEVIGREGGYSNHPSDRGGATRWGVTEAVARAHGWKGDMRLFPREQAVEIYRKLYWLAPGFDRVARHAPAVAAKLFDIGVNMGPKIGAGFLQRALNLLNRGGTDYADLKRDDDIGGVTVAALAAYIGKRSKAGEAVLLAAIEGFQVERYASITEARPANEDFFYGWLANRVVAV